MKSKRKGKKREKRTERTTTEKSECIPGDTIVKNPPANTGDIRDAELILGLGRSFGRGHGNPLQYSCLEDSMEKEAWHYSPRGCKESDKTEAT